MSAAEKLRALKPEGLVESVAPFEGYTDAVCLSIPAHAAVVAVVAALQQTTAALDDAIKAAVTADWSQEDYDEWDAGRTGGEVALAALDEALS